LRRGFDLRPVSAVRIAGPLSLPPLSQPALEPLEHSANPAGAEGGGRQRPAGGGGGDGGGEAEERGEEQAGRETANVESGHVIPPLSEGSRGPLWSSAPTQVADSENYLIVG